MRRKMKAQEIKTEQEREKFFEDGSYKFLRNMGKHMPKSAASHHSRGKPQTSHSSSIFTFIYYRNKSFTEELKLLRNNVM
jgi:hypothetical protein